MYNGGFRAESWLWLRLYAFRSMAVVKIYSSSDLSPRLRRLAQRRFAIRVS